ncbi:MAG: ABC transporter permease [Anaerolineaceae bacterium]|nr:ABC transporter permease [Anaerolineaceae bacterium]
MFNISTRSESNVIKTKKHSEFVVVSKRLSQNSSAVIGFVIAVLLALIAIFAPLISPYPYQQQDLKNTRAAPSVEHIFGTDELGRDIFSRVVWGSRFSLSVGVLAVLLGTIVGMVFGAFAGYFGGVVDDIIMRFIDILQSIPGILLVITISVVLGPGLINTLLALSFGGIPMSCRLLRASIMGVRHSEYLEAATSINASTLRIIMKHVIPNTFSPLLVSSTMSIGNVIMMGAMLSFIGLGVQPPTPEWGSMIAGGRGLIRTCPWMVTFPGLFIMLTVLSLNMFGDGLRDALDPKLKK